MGYKFMQLLNTIFLVLFFCMPAYADSGQPNEEKPIDVSLINLIANPEKYDGKTVRVQGYAISDWAGGAIFLHKDDLMYGIYKNSIGFSFSCKVDDKQAGIFSKHYVSAIGVYKPGTINSIRPYSGSISVFELEVIESENDAIDKNTSRLSCQKLTN